MFNKKGQISIEALIIVSILIVGGIIFATFYLGQRNKFVNDASKISGLSENLSYSDDLDIIVPNVPNIPTTDCGTYPAHCCNSSFDVGLEEGYNCGGNCAPCEPIVEYGCENLGEPTFNPEGGTYNTPISINLIYFDERCPGSEIRYTLNGNEPTISDQLFTPFNNIELTETKTIKAKVFAEIEGNVFSGDTVSQHYVITNSTFCDSIPGIVTFSPRSKTYNSQFKLELNYFDRICSSSNYEILYTKSEDGVPPITENIYNLPIELIDKDTIITARVRVMNSSGNYVFGQPTTETYNFNKFGCDGIIGQPTFTPVGGTYNQPVALRLTYNDAACSDYNIYYTTNNTEPTQSSLVLGNRSIMISTDRNITAKVFAKKSDGTIVSGISKKENYIITQGGSSLCLSGVGGGTGTVSDPKIICTPEELNDIRFGENLSKHYVLGQNIDLNHSLLSTLNLEWGYNEVYGWTPIGLQNNVFSGSLDGNGYKIKNLYINRPNCYSELNSFGLFGYVGGNNPIIRNLELENANVSGCDKVGALVGVSLLSSNFNLDNITVSNVIINSTGVSSGGIIGTHYNGIISNSSVTGNINGISYVGGLTGAMAQNSKIINSSSSATVSGNNGVGGLVANAGGQVINSYSNGNVTGNNTVGGISGVVTGDINQSYFSGTVTGNSIVGGISGSITDSAKIVNSYCTNTAVVNGQTKVGGILGSLSPSNAFIVDMVKDSNFYGTVIGNSMVGGIVGFAYSSNSHSGYYKINNVYFNGNVTGDSNVGGIIGSCQLHLIKYAKAEGNVTGRNNVGGIIGSGGTSSKYLAFSGNINAIGNGTNVGGLVGLSSGSIEKSYSKGTINASQSKNVGGLVGHCLNNDLIINSFSRVNISGDVNVGGLIGNKWIGCGLRNNYSTGLVSGNSNVGGFIGAPAINTGCQWNYWDTMASGQTTSASCNISEYGYVVAGLTGRTTSQMRDWNSYSNPSYDGLPNNFPGIGSPWDFENTWVINSSKNNGYPYLRENYSEGNQNSQN